jgi:hypothetical protein
VKRELAIDVARVTVRAQKVEEAAGPRHNCSPD